MCMHKHLTPPLALYTWGSWELWEGVTGGSYYQATRCRQRAGQAATSLSFIHLFIQLFLLPTGNVLKGMCLKAQGTVPLSSPGFFQINSGHKERPCWSLDTTFSVHSGKCLCQHLKCLWPHRGESGQRLPHQQGCSGVSYFPFSIPPRKSLMILHSYKMPKTA